MSIFEEYGAFKETLADLDFRYIYVSGKLVVFFLIIHNHQYIF